MKLRGIAAFATICAAVASTVLVSGADAAPVSNSAPSVLTVTGAMNLQTAVSLVSTDSAAGTAAVLLTNGKTITVPQNEVSLLLQAGKAAKSAVKSDALTPNNTVGGDCGSSNIYLEEKPNGKPVKMTTGFTVVHDAISYSWYAYISGPSYNYTYHASGDLAFDGSWKGQHTSTDNYPSGYWYAYVSDTSFAVLDDGGVCYSAGPWDSVEL
jgi:hypothetical protein